MKFGIDDGSNKEIGSIKPTFIYANGVWIALVQPTGPGPLMDLLNERADGYIAELIVEVDDTDKYYDDMKEKGVQMLNIDEAPLADDEKGFVLEPYGDKLAYFPKDVSCGMTVPVFQRGPRETSLFHQRDDSWEK